MKSNWTYKYFLFFITLLFFVMEFVVFFQLYRLDSDIKEMSRGLIEKNISVTKTELDRFFKPVEDKLAYASYLQNIGLYDTLNNPYKLNKVFIPLIMSSYQVSSLLISDTTGNEYLLLELDTCFYNRVTKKDSKYELPDEYYWNFLADGSSDLLKKNKRELPYSSKTRPWYQQSVDKKFGEFTWSDAYLFYTTKEPGISVSAKIRSISGDVNIIGFDVKLNDISRFTSSLVPSENGFVFVLSSKSEILGVTQKDSIKNQPLLVPFRKLKIDAINSAMEASIFDSVFSYTSASSSWWGKIESYPLAGGKLLYIGTIVPEQDFLQKIKTKQFYLTVASVLVFALLIIVLVLLIQRNKDNISLSQKNQQFNAANFELSQSIKEKELLLKEIHHRVKNNLQIISGLLYLQSTIAADDDTKIALKNSIDRISSMSLLHEKLYRSTNFSEINLQEYILDLCNAILSSYDTQHKVSLSVSVQQTPLSIDYLVSIGLIINELITNSIKHAFNNSSNGEISIKSTIESGKTVFIYRDNGPGLPADFDFNKLNSFGMEIIRSLSQSINAEISFENNKGMVVKLVFNS